MVTVIVNASLNLALVRVLGFRGLALGTSIAAIVNAAVLVILLRRHLGGLQEGRILASLGRIIVASALMGGAAFLIDGWLQAVLPGASFVRQSLRLGTTIGTAIAVLGAASWVLRIREFNEGLAMVTRRLGRRSR
jgi:putative peptidoglycan lipid II flippase